MHPNQLIIQLIIASGSRQECISVCDEQIENVHELQTQVEDVHLLGEIGLVVDHKLKETNHGRPELPPLVVQPHSTPLLIAEQAVNHPNAVKVQFHWEPFHHVRHYEFHQEICKYAKKNCNLLEPYMPLEQQGSYLKQQCHPIPGFREEFSIA